MKPGYIAIYAALNVLKELDIEPHAIVVTIEDWKKLEHYYVDSPLSIAPEGEQYPVVVLSDSI